MTRQPMTVLIIVLGIAVTGANAAGVEFALGGWQQSISGTLGYEAITDDDIIDLEARIKGESSGVEVKEEERLALPVPMLYMGFQIMPKDWLAFEFEGRGVSVGDNSLVSLVGRVRYNFAGPAFAAAGYRSDMVEIDEDDVVVDADFTGPFVELGLKF